MDFWCDMERWGEATALAAEDGEGMTYAELSQAADEHVVHLATPAGHRGLAFLLAKNCPEAILGYLGFLRSRTVVALQPAGLHGEWLTKLLDAYQPQYLWLPKERAGELPGATELVSRGNYVLLATRAPFSPMHPELAQLLSTSGSTGSPKLVRQSYGNIAANAASIAEYLDIRSADRPITTLPMSYVYGLSVITSHLLRGATIVLTNRGVTEKGFWETLKAREATSFAGVPYTFEMLKRLRFGRMELPSLNVLTQAGGKLSAELVLEFARLCRDQGRKFVVMYGAVEATARMSYLPHSDALEKPASIGIPIPGGDMWLEDEDGHLVEGADRVGELVYRGDNVTMGYASCREDLSLGDDWNGVLHTGDIARRDDDRYYYLVGRKRRFIKVFGNSVNLDEVEQHIRNQGIDCACGGRDDRLCVYVVDASRAGTIAAFVQELTGLHRSACEVRVISEVPRNEYGKINYAALP